MYHLDGHEKIAKVYGFWIFGCVDGYSRFVVLLDVASNKYSG